MFKTNTDIVKKAIDGILPGQWFLRPGDDSNHLMWVAGHLVAHRGAVLKSLGAEWETSWSSLFTRGAKLATQDKYPQSRKFEAPGTKFPRNSWLLSPKGPQTCWPSPHRKAHLLSMARLVGLSPSWRFTEPITYHHNDYPLLGRKNMNARPLVACPVLEII
jgi:hypothetical protein